MFRGLFDDLEPEEPAVEPLPDEEARARAVDPAHHVVLEASAGTGKTHVLVNRYLNLLSRGVDPLNILAITFTRKAAAEMRERILKELRQRASGSSGGVEEQAVWSSMRERAADISIGTIDAFCLSLLHEFPLEADLDPGFDIADETQAPHLMEEALDRAMEIGRALAKTDDRMGLLFAKMREPRLREGLESLINRRLVVQALLERALRSSPRDLTVERLCERTFEQLARAFAGLPGGLDGFLADGPVGHRRYGMLVDDMRAFGRGRSASGIARSILDRIGVYFLKDKGEPRKRPSTTYKAAHADSAAAWKSHVSSFQAAAPEVARVLAGFKRDVNVLLSQGAGRFYHIAAEQYARTLEAHGVLDFSEALARAIWLLSQMEEFARSRYRLEARYHHVLVDEFQDTSRAQWELVALLVRSWGEGAGLSESAAVEPTIFLVGDRKQSIYGFRDADVSVMRDAGDFVDQLRPGGGARRAISRSFRAVPRLLAFINDLFAEVDRNPGRPDAFEFAEQDRFPIAGLPDGLPPALGIVAGPSAEGCAEAVAAEIARLIESGEMVRDPGTREPRPVSPRDIGILFRTKEGHQHFEQALARRGVPAYVYKGLGFFDADEIKDVVALVQYLAAPDSNLRAAALLRSRFVRLSDPALQALAPHLARALSARGDLPSSLLDKLGAEDRRVLALARARAQSWLALVDRLPPADLLELALDETAYLFETRGPRAAQARENLKKIRSTIRRLQNRGYATMARVAEHMSRLRSGDESNAVIDAGDSVSLMTIHAAKGLEFPIVFVVNLFKGAGGGRAAIRVAANEESGEAWISVGEFKSAADEDARAREREETKRLLYVALTRARDRLYLSTPVIEGTALPRSGSLGAVMPRSFQTLFEAAASSSEPMLQWASASGQVHPMVRCAVPEPATSTMAAPAVSVAASEPDRFEPLADPFALPRLAVTEAPAPVRHARGAARAKRLDRRVAGTLVHRLFDRAGTTLASTDVREVAARLALLVRDEEAVGIESLDELLERAATAYLALCRHADLTEALAAGTPMFEVPFSLRAAGAAEIRRGTFDCVVSRRDSGVTILELKTGQPVPEHERQLATYLAAARALFPGTPIDGRLIYTPETA